MEPGELIFSLLSQAPAVSAIVGSRIYPVRAEQGKPRPYIVYQLIDNNPTGGPGCELDDEARVQISVYADSYSQLSALTKAVRQKLHYYEAPGVYIQWDGDHDLDDPQAACYFRTQDYLLELATEPALILPEPENNQFDYSLPLPLA